MDSTDRRQVPRFAADAVGATLRLQYRLARIQAEVIDFNRYGISLRVDRALPMHHTVDLSLSHRSVTIEGIVGVIHNCRALKDGMYRCGVRFRTDTRAQFDRDQIRAALLHLESLMSHEQLVPARTSS